ncbi:endonuclease III domain-containing protein [Spirochaeta cellobiosiphila]|uniref:endonuclease III domain-containing protein n=1 Tax=Spirochaeta cellobiosiphila TaxID=504483 RepID=UPI0003F8147A|nr:endonuclease III [Spirochaeta cellobiosiphila]
MNHKNDKYWDELFNKLECFAQDIETPSVSILALEKATPFMLLISTILSLRTKDEVTLASSRRLFKTASTPEEIIQLPTATIEELIYPAGFYKRKAQQIKNISHIIISKHKGAVPQSKEALLELPGVGLKTTNLVLSLAFNIPAICVDTHVHRIANRMGWISTKTAEESEPALSAVLPLQYWIPVNEYLVVYGQNICKPTSPYCSICMFTNSCPKIAVTKSR